MKKENLIRISSSIGAFAVVILLWQVCVKEFGFFKHTLPAPSDVAVYLWNAIFDATLPNAIWVTIKRLLLGYAIGLCVGIPTGMLCARFRVFNDTIGILALGLQALPSVCWVPLAIMWFGQTEFAMLFVVIGHIYPVTMKGKGGKGIATLLGAFWASLTCESGWFALIGLGVLIALVVFLIWTEWGSLTSMTGVSTFSIIQAVIYFNRYSGMEINAYLVCVYAFIIALNFLTWFAHRGNVVRLFAGEERRTSLKKMAKKKKKV